MAQIQCGCGQEINVPFNAVGKAARCAGCKKILRFVAPGLTEGDLPAAQFGARLVVEGGPDRVGEQIFIGGSMPIDVGKSPELAITLKAPLISQRHCTLTPMGNGDWAIEDNGSTNGLYVDRRQVQGQDLIDGQLITVGDYSLRFRSTGSQTETADDWTYNFVQEPPPPPQAPRPAPVARKPGPVCPSCQEELDFGAKICVSCGINLVTGRPIVISQGIDENVLYGNVDTVVRWLSIILRIGLFPIASDAYGKHKPRAIPIIALATTLITIVVWIVNASNPDSGPYGPTKDLMLWAGDRPNLLMVYRAYHGDDAVSQEFREKEHQAFSDRDKAAKGKSGQNPTPVTELPSIQAYDQLPPEDQRLGSFHFYQLLTNAFLHGSIMHLAGNLVFLLVFGNRINALLGDWKTTVLYLVLGVLASISFYLSRLGHPLIPALGASGAIMGLAGMYLVLMPVSRVYMVFWLRLGLLTGFRRLTKIFALRGFWVLLFFIAFDVWATLRGSHDGTAHWAHLGGFMCGMVIALGLLLTRQVNANGGDIISLVLGPRAWKILGTPASRMSVA